MDFFEKNGKIYIKFEEEIEHQFYKFYGLYLEGFFDGMVAENIKKRNAQTNQSKKRCEKINK